MLFKLTRGIFIMLILACCGCQERQSDVTSTSSELGRQHKGNPGASTVMVYYFHRTARCFTCLSIEANAAQVVKDNFHQQMADGTLIWVPFNLDDPGGEEFRREFDITTSTLVVTKRVDADRVEFEKLEKVWQLLGDPDRFSEYVTHRINKFLNDK
ncbi:nitrophenyl compound nitroreductase subunit ArsF family protein [Planctomycetota bacterium]